MTNNRLCLAINLVIHSSHLVVCLAHCVNVHGGVYGAVQEH
jgi:hypothetical protein